MGSHACSPHSAYIWSVELAVEHEEARQRRPKSMAVALPTPIVAPRCGSHGNAGVSAANAAKVVGALLLGLLVLHGAPAMAQTRKAVAAPATSAAGVPCDPLSLIPGCTPSAASTALSTGSANLQTIWSEIVSATQADLTYAEALATNVNSPGGKLRATCYAAIITANSQANGMTLKNADGSPMVAPSPDVISKFEQGAELVDNLQATAPVMSACAAAANAIGQSTTQFLATLLSAVAIKAAVPAIP